jgi:hypothetical protein
MTKTHSPRLDPRPAAPRRAWAPATIACATLGLALAAAPASAHDGRPGHAHTSTSAMPEDTGVLPRAQIPEAAVGDAWSRRTPTDTTDPTNPSKPRGTQPPSQVDDARPVVEPEAEGSAPPPHKPPRRNNSASALDEARPTKTHVDEPRGLSAMAKAQRPKLITAWHGFFRAVGEVVEDDPSGFIGKNDGFRVGNVRLGFSARYGDLDTFLSIEGAVARSLSFNDPNAELSVGLRDAFLGYKFHEMLSLRAGRFKTPYDLGELEPTGLRVFIDSPLESRGVEATRGFVTPGLSGGRQIGVMLFSDRMGLSKDGFDLGYVLALTNGFTGDRVFNDNDHFAGHARLTLHYSDWLSLNGAGFIDRRTNGTLPNLFDDDVVGAEGSLQISWSGLRVEGQFLFQRRDPVTAATGAYDAWGFHAQAAYLLFDSLEPGYRFALLEPNSRVADDQVNEHTIGLTYYFDDIPLRLTANGTLAFEQRAVNNHRVAMMAQFIF